MNHSAVEKKVRIAGFWKAKAGHLSAKKDISSSWSKKKDARDASRCLNASLLREVIRVSWMGERGGWG